MASDLAPDSPVFSNNYQQIFNQDEEDYAQYVHPASGTTSSSPSSFQPRAVNANRSPPKNNFKWQWRADSSGWRDYQKQHSKNIEEQYGNKDKLTITIGNTSYCIDFKQLKQFNLVTDTARAIRRVPLHSTSSNKPAADKRQRAVGADATAKWQVNLSGSWTDYDVSASKFIESKFSSNTSVFECTVRGQSYFIDLSQTVHVQINLDTGNSRAIRRVAPSTLYMDDGVLFGVDDDCKQGLSAPAHANSDQKNDDVDQHMQQQMSAMTISKPPSLLSDENASDAYKWQWMNDDGAFTDFERDASQKMEALHSRNAKSHIYKAPKNSQVYHIDFVTLTQRNSKTDAVRPIRRCRSSTKQAQHAHAASPRIAGGKNRDESVMKWQWFDLDGRVFVDYDKKVSIAIEAAYKQRKSEHQFVSDKTKANYRVDFTTMQQVNAQSKMRRAVRRVPLSVQPQKPTPSHSGPDPKTWKGPKVSARRRVFGKKILTLYHVTDSTSAGSIWKERKMIRGSAGMFGGGIYFAESVAAATYKAQRKGVLITAKVFVGKEHAVQSGNAGQFSFQEMQKMGCDSVYAPNGSGGGQPERVVYNFDQVCVISKKASP